jgi:phosphatidylglycerol:prolipoprotein diacylglycerol transferase
MYPEIFHIGPFVLRSYGLLIAIGIVVGFLSMRNRAKKLGLSEDDILDLLLYLIIGGLIGAKIMYILTNDLFYFVNNPIEIIRSGGTGLSFIGIVIAGVLITYWFAKRKKINYWGLLDVLAIGTTLGYAIGRIGCFLNGCCYGIPTDSWIGFRFSVSDYPRYPTQLFNSIGAFIIFLILLRVEPNKKFYGKTFSWALILYSILTFFVEFLRDNPRHAPLGLTLNQYSTFIIVPLGIIFLIRLSESEQIKEVEGFNKFKYGYTIDQQTFDEDLNVVDKE